MGREFPEYSLTEIVSTRLPRLALSGDYEQRSDPDQNYNCIAFAIGIRHEWWWPSGRSDHYWPKCAPLEVSLHAFISVLEGAGYRLCVDGRRQRFYERVVLYAKNGEPKHAALQEKSTGMWLSKLGPYHDIAHRSVDDVGGEDYGEVVCYMRRRSRLFNWRKRLRALR